MSSSAAPPRRPAVRQPDALGGANRGGERWIRGPANRMLRCDEDHRIGVHTGAMMRATVAAVLATLMASCGGDEPSGDRKGSTPAARPTATAAAEAIPAAEWSRRAEELCDEMANRAEREVVELQREVENEGGSREEFVARVIERSAALSEPMLDELAALPAPEGKQPQAKRFERELRDLLPTFGEMAEAVRDGDRSAVQRLSQEMLRAAASTRALARDLNIHACIPRSPGP